MNDRYSQEGVGESGTSEDVFSPFFSKERYLMLSSLLDAKMHDRDNTYPLINDVPAVMKGFNIPKGRGFTAKNPLGKLQYTDGMRYSGKNKFFDLSNHEDITTQNKPTKASNFEQDFVPSFVGIFEKYSFLKDYPLERVVELYAYAKESVNEELESLLDEKEITKANIDMWFKDMDSNRTATEETAAAKTLFSKLNPDIHSKLVKYIQSDTGMTAAEIENEVGESLTLSDLYSYLEAIG